MYKSITISKGSGGWGGPLTIIPTANCNKIVSVTGGGIHPVAIKIAEMTGCEAIDGFTTAIPDDQILVAVVDCGGTARCGVYPKKNIFTVNLTPVGKVGPLAQFISENLYVSAVNESCLTYAPEGTPLTSKDGSNVGAAQIATNKSSEPKTKAQARAELAKMNAGKEKNFITKLGIGVGGVVNKFYQAGRETIDMVVKTILPFMAFVSMIIGIISASGIGDIIAHTISPLASTLPGMLVISVVCSLPFISPVIGPGAVIAQVVGTLLGVEIGLGHIPAQYALPALFAINAQVGGDFVPVGLSLGEADPETIELGVPAVLYSRVITGPLSVIIAYIFSFGMYM
jgi:PTS system glucitol/sorbitol-specific IIC component